MATKEKQIDLQEIKAMEKAAQEIDPDLVGRNRTGGHQAGIQHNTDETHVPSKRDNVLETG